jgi:hypothetical protein
LAFASAALPMRSWKLGFLKLTLISPDGVGRVLGGQGSGNKLALGERARAPHEMMDVAAARAKALA